MTTKQPIKKGLDARARLRLGILIVLVLAAAALLVPKPAPLTQELSSTDASPAPTVLSDAPTAAPNDARGVREQGYDKDIATLQGLIDSEHIDAETRAQAAERLRRMVSDHQSELGIEQALRSAGFTPCLVLMQNGSLTIMVSEPELTGAQSAAILSVCVAHAEIGVENVRIMTGQAM